MSQHTISRIANVLERQFTGKIDLSDWKGRPDPESRLAFLSRAVAALCIKTLAATDVDVAGRAVTDGFNDGGIDAIYFDQNTDTLFLVQSKWSDDGSTPLNGGASAKFVDGVQDLLNAKFDRFNERVKAKEAEIRAALYSSADVKIVLVTAHTATQPIGMHGKRRIDDYIEELNNPVPVARSEYFDQSGVYGLVTSESEPQKITLPITLRDWGIIDKPFMAYYGRVHVIDVARWWADYGDHLFNRNLRHFFGSSNVNDALRKTLGEQPENFWYFNNGITVICDSLSKSLAGAPGRELGLFNCENVSVVNGAQTVGTIGTAGLTSKSPAEKIGQSWVQVRIISLAECPPKFDLDITRATNFQNAVSKRDFAAMDPVQHRLATEFALDRRQYIYKSGEEDPRGEEGCSITEATQALACAHSIGLAVQAKREIGELWVRTDAPPYVDLFNDALSGTKVWRSVLVMRAVDDELQQLRRLDLPRADMIGIHLNRAILHLIFQDRAIRSLRHDDADERSLINAARAATKPVFLAVADYIQKNHEYEYLASLAKNLGKCEELATALLGPKATPAQATLFPEEIKNEP
jgi:hypothetical protein